MLNILKDKKFFFIVFYIVLFIDTIVKINLPIWPYRYISKPPVMGLLILYFYYNNTASKNSDYSWTMLALACFFVSDFLIIDHENIYLLVFSLFIYSVAKLFLCFRFSHRSDFKVRRLIPFSIVIFIYTVGLVSYMFDDLGHFFLPTIISYFISLLLCQFAYLRKGVVDEKSYLFVFVGVLCYMLSEGIMVIKTFKTNVPYQDFSIMFFYATGIYLIVHGIITEKITESKNPF
ncbi:lysoplasmalogenase family protein [Tamlana sp. 2_MG-2023]|uniref:lysoplasmalogenase family protein n=1 Tax=unclassified Tamlana TaxID=2614803 RepID=UPI0026E2FAC9|nr:MULTISPECIES: lysoplasmalogenase family protein [unclassified Tamlana]MDO6760066.1 lysoplasmalogenase family protein [Tamlana sp. 2_MG-2023]MDO6790236.1 lysoplasmalogenase family protein [Tamlana sp. 1_MG-2023]